MRFGVGLFSLQCTAMQPRHWTGAYRDMRELASLMEELGYDELWLSEHHFFYDGYCPALLPAAASVLSVTDRLRVGTGMLLLPMYDPARLAAVATDLAERSADGSTSGSAWATATSSSMAMACRASSAFRAWSAGSRCSSRRRLQAARRSGWAPSSSTRSSAPAGAATRFCSRPPCRSNDAAL